MTLDELKIKKFELDAQEDAIFEQERVLEAQRHTIHQKLLDLYQDYVNEHFPYKVGDVLEYSFVNRDGDMVIRIISVAEISTHTCDLSNIIIHYYYECKNNLNNTKEGRINHVKIDGTISHSMTMDGAAATLKKLG